MSGQGFYLNFDSRMGTLLEIMKALKDPDIETIVVRGICGVGKTTLVKQVALSCAAEKKLFDQVVMMTLGQHGSNMTDLKGVQRQLANLLGLKLNAGDEDEHVTKSINERLMKVNKVLVILDDVWDLKQLYWIKSAAGIPSRCKTLCTSSSLYGENLYPSRFNAYFKIGVLEKEEAWRLFEKITGDAAKDPHLEAIGKRVAERCQGLPYLIVAVAAGLMKRATIAAWMDALGHLEQLKNKERQEIVNSALEYICYNHLDGLQKSLFLLCGLLGNGDQISISDLTIEWLQLEGIERSLSLDTLIFDLKSSYLLQEVDNNNYVTNYHWSNWYKAFSPPEVSGSSLGWYAFLSKKKKKHSYVTMHDEKNKNSYVTMHGVVRYAAIAIATKTRDVMIQYTGEPILTTGPSKAADMIQYVGGSILAGVFNISTLERLLGTVVNDSEIKSMELLKEIKALIRMNDLVSLVSSYPMQIVTEKMYEQWSTWMGLFSKLNAIRQRSMQYYSTDLPKMKKLRSQILRDFSEIKPMLKEILTYLPVHMIEDIDNAPELKTLLEHRKNVEVKPPLQGKKIYKTQYEAMEEAEVLPKPVVEFTIDSAIRHLERCIETADWIGISGEGRNEVIQAFKKDGADMVGHLISLTVSEDSSSSTTSEQIEEDITSQPGVPMEDRYRERDMLYSNRREGTSLYLIDFDEGVDVIQWLHEFRVGALFGHQRIVFITRSPVSSLPVDLQIKMEDHALPWELFCSKVGHVVHSSTLTCEMAAEIVKLCGGNLTATNLMASALRDVADVSVWKEAVSQFGAPLNRRDRILYSSVNFVSKSRSWGLTTKHCIVESLCDCPKTEWVDSKSLITRWTHKGITDCNGEGEEILNDLVDASLFEYSSTGALTRIKPDLHDVISSIFSLSPIIFFFRGTQPSDEEWDCKEINLNSADTAKLPANPSCSGLQNLFLQDNHVLTVIPPGFFNSMKVLKAVNLSNTSIKALPESFFKLGSLTELLLRDCRLFMELPPQIGDLLNLKMLDLQGTEIIELPVEVKQLINLTCLRLSFYGYGKLPKHMIHEGVLVKLSNLIELSIDVNPDDQRWENDVKFLMKEIVRLKQLRNIKLYLPQVEQIDYFRKYLPSLIFLKDSRFGFTVGTHFRRIMSWEPLEVKAEFQKRGKSLRYVNGSELQVKRLRYVLQRTKAFFLDSHYTVTKLSQFGTENLKQLEYCVLGECSELQTIIEEGPHSLRGDYESDGEDEDSEEDYDEGSDYEKDDSWLLNDEPVLESLEYLIVYNMENLSSIWISNGSNSIHKKSLSHLKSLTLNACPKLSILFSVVLLDNLGMLEELIVEDCPSIQNLVLHPQSSNLSSKAFLPKLKKISLHYLPELVSISNGLRIAPKLEWVSFYDCPLLKSLSTKEVSSDHLKKIKGEEEWWSELEWKIEQGWVEGRPSKLDQIFSPFKEDEDLLTQLAEDENPVRHLELIESQLHNNQQNGPLNSQNVADFLQKHNLMKAVVQKALDSLADTGRISFKEYGKQKIYMAQQDWFDIPNSEELSRMKEKNFQVRTTARKVEESH